ncbi:response regulator [Niastella caeni]|uniref:histidine kinase n=1 Tax=Niastella caeni TaxID=2569763 RepID=A0A4S8HGA8_9BACT|nr:hybrid sensor histidine kinase/response regulator [Niastella caeni]THU34047.1 response regulator [Niastella caeni]
MKALVCLLLLILPCNCFVAFSQQQIRFEHLGINDGLSQSNVTCILQDSRGFMWFGTKDGINSYDGYRFTVFKKNATDTNSLSHNFIKSIAEDNKGNIWIGTYGGGVNRFNRNKRTFTHYTHNTQNANSIGDNFITSLQFDTDGILWIGTQTGGLNRLDPNTNQITKYVFNKNDPNSVSDNFINAIYEDSRKRLWIGTLRNGLNLFDKKTGVFMRFQHNPKDDASLSSNTVCRIFEDSNHRLWIGTLGGGLNVLENDKGGFRHFKNDPANCNSLPINVVFALAEDDAHNIWVGTENGGLSILNPQTGIFTTYTQDDIDDQSLTNNSIYSVYKDRQGNMWVGTYNGGINLYSKGFNKFVHYRHSSLPNSLSHNKLLGICEGTDGDIWLGTDGGGLNRFNPRTKQFTRYAHKKGNTNSICGDVIISLYGDMDDNIWMGSYGEGITIYNTKNNTYKHLKHETAIANSLCGNNICAISQDADKEMWIGTYGYGLDKYNIQTGRFTNYRHDSTNQNSLSSDRVVHIRQDSRGYIWVGTFEGGLNLLDKKTGIFTRFMHNDHSNSISSNQITYIFEDKFKNIWIGTHFGLNCYNPTTRRFTVYTMRDGLSGNIIYGITEDSKSNLWLSTNNGICRFNPITKACKKFSAADGLQSNEFSGTSALKSRSGHMYFGGVNGFNEFSPNSIHQEIYDAPLIFTGFQIFNKEVPVADALNPNSPLTQSISETKKIVLSYNSSVISFDFVSLNYTSKEKRQYAYRLMGFDKDWNYIGTRHSATYTNLDPGNYILEVKGLNTEGEWSTQTTSLQLIILPPFWLTLWFKLLIGIGVIAGVLFIYRYRVRSIKAKNAALEILVQERTQQLGKSINEERSAREDAERARAEAEQANKAKSIFLATMSHEIRTPMNGVIGMASLLAQTSLNEEQRSYTETIQTCGENLLTVINDILDFSKIESGKMELEEKEFNLRICIEEVLDMFAPKAAQIGLDLVYQIECNVPHYITGDTTRLRQILINLVGNAIKFTHKGEVFVRVYLMKLQEDNTVQLGFEVRDTGIGIPKDKLERLFKAFSQVDSSTTRKYGGTGLGLVICEKLIRLMGGYIEVESKPGKGSVFAFTIAAKTACKEITDETLVNANDIAGKRILIVDDNATNRKILKMQLEEWRLQPALAASGQQALDILNSNQHFDLVLTDMHMPEMSGIELAEQIRSLYPKLPIMLLSSVGDDLSKEHRDLFSFVLTKPIKQQALFKYILNTFSNAMNVVTEKETSNPNVLQADFAEQFPLQILLAEDNPFNQAVATAILNKLGYQFEIADNGEQVLEKMQQKSYDVILMDVQMPEMDGLEATRIIRETYGTQPVIIAMTANAMQEDKEECLHIGMNDYLSKPVDLDDLVLLLKKWAINVIKAKRRA